MERKIGEIFNYQDNWYQCIENTGYGCIICHFNTHNNICCNNVLNIIGNCLPPYRKDYKSVVFRKLEKVGEPTMLDGKLVQKILTTDRYSCNGCCFESPGCDKADNDLCCEHEIYVEIKQNKEDMEEEKLNLKKFDLEEAKAGKPVCTRDGRKARIISFDLNNKNFPIVAIINCDTEENAYQYDIDGICDEHDNNLNLMMFPEKKEGWVNLCKNNYGDTLAVGVFPNREEAVSNCPPSYLCTIKIEWEE